MKKRAKILLVIIIIIAVLMGLLYLISLLTNLNITGNSIGFSQRKQQIDQSYVESIIEQGVENLNKEEKYLQFINDSKYNSIELIIDKESYYLEYDTELNKIFLVEQQDVDFSIKISKRKFNKAVSLYEQGNVKGAAMKIVGEIPRIVKIDLFKQCMETEWCKQGNF